MKDLFSGARHLLAGLKIIRQPGLRRYVMVPLTVNIAVFGGLIYQAIYWYQILLDKLLGFLPGWLAWLQYLLLPLFAVTVVLIVFYGFTLLANLIAAPFNGLLAEAVERHLTGQPVADSGDWKTLVKDIVPSVLSEVRKLLYFILWAIPFGILFLIPGVNLAAPVLWGLFSAWMFALEYCDYPMGNHHLFFAAQRARLRRRRMLSLGFGGTTLLFTLIPVVNFIAMPVAVAGATSLWVRELRDSGDS
jgi:CysZ protein